MKKRDKRKISKGNIWLGILIIALLIAAVLIGMQTNFYGVAIGVLLGFLVSTLMNNIRN